MAIKSPTDLVSSVSGSPRGTPLSFTLCHFFQDIMKRATLLESMRYAGHTLTNEEYSRIGFDS